MKGVGDFDEYKISIALDPNVSGRLCQLDSRWFGDDLNSFSKVDDYISYLCVNYEKLFCLEN